MGKSSRYGSGVFEETVEYYLIFGEKQEIEIPVSVHARVEWESEVEGGRVYYSYDFPTAPLIATGNDGKEYTLAGQDLEDFWYWLRAESEHSNSFRGSSEWEKDFREPDDDDGRCSRYFRNPYYQC
jgi:hypothetical protein